MEKTHTVTRKKNKIKKVLTVILIIVVIIFALIIIFSILRNNAKKESVVSAAKDAEVTSSENTYRMRDDITNILILGIDKEEDMNSVTSREDAGKGGWGQNDVNYLLSIDEKNQSIHLFMIPRDTYVKVTHYDEDGNVLDVVDDQLCVAFPWGPDGKEKSCEAVAKDISDIFDGISIKEYIAVNMKVFPKMAAALDGITITPDKDYVVNGKTYKAGQEYTLKNETQIENWVRFRDTSEAGSAETRAARQDVFMIGLKNAMSKKIKENPMIAKDLYDAMGDDKYTSINSMDMINLVAECSKMSFDTEITVLPGTVNTDEKYERYMLDEDGVKDIVIKYFCEKVE